MTNLPNPNPDFRIDGPGEYLTYAGKTAKVTGKINTAYDWNGYISSGEACCWTNSGEASRLGLGFDIIAKASTAAGEGLPSPIVAGWYKARNSEKFYVIGLLPNPEKLELCVAGVTSDSYDREVIWWDKNGKYFGNQSLQGRDLVAPWQEPVVVDAVLIMRHGKLSLAVYDSIEQAKEGEPDCSQYIHIRITDGVAEIIPENGDE